MTVCSMKQSNANLVIALRCVGELGHAYEHGMPYAGSVVPLSGKLVKSRGCTTEQHRCAPNSPSTAAESCFACRDVHECRSVCLCSAGEQHTSAKPAASETLMKNSITLMTTQHPDVMNGRHRSHTVMTSAGSSAVLSTGTLTRSPGGVCQVAERQLS
jgi:hypothetical protein